MNFQFFSGKKQRLFTLFLLLVLLASLFPSCKKKPDSNIILNGESREIPLSAQLSEIIGQVLARQPEEEFIDVGQSFVLEHNGQVKTMQDSRVRLDTSNGTIIRLGPNTLFTLLDQEEKSSGLFTRIRIEAGKLWAILSGGELEIETPSGLAAVRGSYLSVDIDPQTGKVFITCLEGNCSAESDGGLIKLTGGQTALITNISLPPVIGRMDHHDVEQWLLINPESTVVVIPLTETVAHLPTSTIQASKTLMTSSTLDATAKITETSVPTQANTKTPQPTATQRKPVILQDVVCYDGPGSDYSTIGTLFQGAEVNVVGVGSAGYVIVEVPGRPGVTCWVNTILVQGADQISKQILTATLPMKPTAISNLPTWTPVIVEEEDSPSATPIPTETPDHTMYFSSEYGPEGNLSDSIACTHTYSVNVTDIDGVDWVAVYWSDAVGFSPNDWFLCNLSPSGGDLYAWGCSLPATTTGPIFWRFAGGDFGSPTTDTVSFVHDATISGSCP
ncbi:MAG: FecR domain-containing protein [Anaerolineaceae bacterium]|nr:FecR domain-containing protein [Anaerolineaceae bacterium]